MFVKQINRTQKQFILSHFRADLVRPCMDLLGTVQHRGFVGYYLVTSEVVAGVMFGVLQRKHLTLVQWYIFQNNGRNFVENLCQSYDIKQISATTTTYDDKQNLLSYGFKEIYEKNPPMNSYFQFDYRK